MQPTAAEDHGAIGDVESLLGKINQDIRAYLRDHPMDPMSAVIHMVAAHNTLDRVGGYAPCQWAYGRFPSLDGRLYDGGHDIPVFTSQGTPGHTMRENLVSRVHAEEVYRRSQAAQRISRALNSKATPAQALSHSGVDVAGKPTLSRWYGPARVLATETRKSESTDHLAFRPGHIVWLIAGGRLKRCSNHQVRHCSEREKLIAEASGGFMTYPWSFTDLIQKVGSGNYDDSGTVREAWRLGEDLHPEQDPSEPQSTSTRSRESQWIGSQGVGTN